MEALAGHIATLRSMVAKAEEQTTLERSRADAERSRAEEERLRADAERIRADALMLRLDQSGERTEAVERDVAELRRLLELMKAQPATTKRPWWRRLAG